MRCTIIKTLHSTAEEAKLVVPKLDKLDVVTFELEPDDVQQRWLIEQYFANINQMKDTKSQREWWNGEMLPAMVGTHSLDFARELSQYFERKRVRVAIIEGPRPDKPNHKAGLNAADLEGGLEAGCARIREIREKIRGYSIERDKAMAEELPEAHKRMLDLYPQLRGVKRPHYGCVLGASHRLEDYLPDARIRDVWKEQITGRNVPPHTLLSLVEQNGLEMEKRDLEALCILQSLIVDMFKGDYQRTDSALGLLVGRVGWSDVEKVYGSFAKSILAGGPKEERDAYIVNFWKELREKYADLRQFDSVVKLS